MRRLRTHKKGLYTRDETDGFEKRDTGGFGNGIFAVLLSFVVLDCWKRAVDSRPDRYLKIDGEIASWCRVLGRAWNDPYSSADRLYLRVYAGGCFCGNLVHVPLL